MFCEVIFLDKRQLGDDYRENVAKMDSIFRVNENFDILRKVLRIGKDELTFYFIDGFIKDAVMQKMMMHFLSLEGLPASAHAAADFVDGNVPYVESDAVEDVDQMVQMMLSGAALVLGSTFGRFGVVIDARTYPARETQEPQDDRVMRGSRDGFVETLIFNTALVRRRVRDTSLTMKYLSVGAVSRTDVVLCYMEGRADAAYVKRLYGKLTSLKTESLTMGTQSLMECLIGDNWYNPFPKVRTTERPDAAVAQLLEGSILVIVDNSPQVMVLPASIFDFLQETNDFYFPPLTGTYMRLVRHVVFWLTLFLTPLWYLLVKNPAIVPDWLTFILPEGEVRVPLIAQLFLVEFLIDGLRLASMNTPDMLSNSLSVVSGLILGDFAVQIGWLSPEVILYMAFVAIANFTQRNYELGYAFKFLRMLLLLLTALFNYWGFGIGVVLTLLLIACNKTVNGKRNYLYPLIPFSGRALFKMFVRVRKED